MSSYQHRQDDKIIQGNIVLKINVVHFSEQAHNQFALRQLAPGFALSTIGLVKPSYQACYLSVAGFFVSARNCLPPGIVDNGREPLQLAGAGLGNQHS